MSSSFNGDEIAPFFGFMGASAALIFSCTFIGEFTGTPARSELCVDVSSSSAEGLGFGCSLNVF